MFKWLDKYMDNLKSPYWEVYFWIIVIAFGLAGTAIIFIDPMGLASKFGNAGSFLGGLFTIVAVIIAVIGYKASKNENHKRMGLEAQAELSFKLLPMLMESIESEANYLRSVIYEAKHRKWDVLDDEYRKVDERIKNLDNTKKDFMVKINYLKKYLDIKNKNDEPYRELLTLINEVLKLSKSFTTRIKYVDKKIINHEVFEIRKNMLEIAFYKKYIKRSVEQNHGLTCKSDFVDLNKELIRLNKKIKSYIAL